MSLEKSSRRTYLSLSRPYGRRAERDREFESGGSATFGRLKLLPEHKVWALFDLDGHDQWYGRALSL